MVDYRARGRAIKGLYGASLGKLVELDNAIKSGDFQRQGNNIIYAGGRRMSVEDMSSHAAMVENMGALMVKENVGALPLAEKGLAETNLLLKMLSTV